MPAAPPDLAWIGALARTLRQFGLGYRLEQSLQFVVPLGLGVGAPQKGPGGHHRSVMIAEQIRKGLGQAGYRAKINHRDVTKPV